MLDSSGNDGQMAHELRVTVARNDLGGHRLAGQAELTAHIGFNRRRQTARS